jgi:FkbM family methyltransferase
LIVSNVTAVMTPTAFLAAARLARVQAVQAACAATSGMRHMDYFLSARWNEPDGGAAAHYTERLFLMDEGFNYYAYRHDRDKRSLNVDRNTLGIPENAVVFCSGANFFKIVPELASTWAKILAQVPDSVLILYPYNPNWKKEYSSKAFQTRLTADLAAQGVDFGRVRILPRQPARADIHEIVKLADVYLDSHPFSGVCSLYDPLSLACPVVAWRGTTMRSLHSTGMLRQLDAEDLAAVDEPDYIAKAVRLALDPPARAAVRERLRVRMADGNPFEDSRRFSAKVGAALQEMFAAYRDGREVWIEKPAAELKTEAQRLADGLRGNIYYEGLTDIELARSLVKPYFQWLDDLPEEPCMVDVGACYGQLAVFFLDMGWQGELFDPDPAALVRLEAFAKNYPNRARIFPYAVSDRASNDIEFHQSRITGLSGLGVSPYGGPEQLIRVRGVRLGDFLNEQGIKHIEFLKIDAEGWDFKVLESHDFEELPPRAIMVEYGAGQDGRSFAEVAQGMSRMAGRGYDAVVFEYDDDGNFKRGQWVYRLINMYIDRPFAPSHGHSFGNIVFYRQGDRAFLATLIALLESFQDTRQGQRGN